MYTLSNFSVFLKHVLLRANFVLLCNSLYVLPWFLLWCWIRPLQCRLPVSPGHDETHLHTDARVGGEYVRVARAGNRLEFVESTWIPFTVTMEFWKVVGPAIIWKLEIFFAANMERKSPRNIITVIRTECMVDGEISLNELQIHSKQHNVFWMIHVFFFLDYTRKVTCELTYFGDSNTSNGECIFLLLYWCWSLLQFLNKILFHIYILKFDGTYR